MEKKFHICKTLLAELFTLAKPYANFKASFKPFLTSTCTCMKTGESDTTQPSLLVTPCYFHVE